MDRYLVVGGCGFLGDWIVKLLLERGEASVAVFDIVQRTRHEKVKYYTGDITSAQDVQSALQDSRVTCIIHTASPVTSLGKEIYEKVNVQGTRVVIQEAKRAGVRKLVYTSSSSIVFGGDHVINGDERMPIVKVHMDAYNETKARAERLVLEANDSETSGGLLTCALRPAGIFGPGDRQAIPGLATVVKRGQTKFQIGPNDNLVDFTYVENVALAHLLAADRLELKVPAKEFFTPLKPLSSFSVPLRHPPTSAHLDEKASDADDAVEIQLRNKFDQFALLTLDSDPIPVAGQAYFITNGEPTYFWDFARQVWKSLDHIAPYTLAIPKPLGLLLGTLAEWSAWLTGKEPGFSRFRLTFSCAHRYYNIEKARRMLKYEPRVGLEEGIKRAVASLK